MSAALYPTRLYWVGLHHCARLEGQQLAIADVPHLPGLQVQALDYAPGACAMVMPKGEGWREMTAAEIHATRELLASLPTHH